MLIAHCAHIINHDSLMDELHQDALHNGLELNPEPDIRASDMSLATMTFIWWNSKIQFCATLSTFPLHQVWALR